MKTETTNCKKCGAKIDVLSVFPGGICLCCHEKKFDAEVARNGGILPRPDFHNVFTKQTNPNQRFVMLANRIK